MFLRIRYLNMDFPSGQIYYLIEDTQFARTIAISISAGQISEEIAIIEAYKDDNKSIAKSLATYYIKKFRINNEKSTKRMFWIMEDISYFQKVIDNSFPQIEYGSKYYPCILRKIEQLLFGSGIINRCL